MPKVSVIMGVYNAHNEEAFCQSINSILAQTYTEFEFIVCDDGSTDDTYQMLADIAKTDSRMILLKNEKNCGLAFSLNRCIEQSSGDILVRQDIDDYSELNRISLLVSTFEQNPKLALVGSNINLYNTHEIWGESRYKEFPQKEDFLFAVPFMHGAVAMRKAETVNAGGYTVSKRTRRTEDYDLFMRLYAGGCLGYNIQQKLYNYKEDRNAQKKRLYRYRIDEAFVRMAGFQSLGLLPKGIPYIIKPLIVGLIPLKILNLLKDKYYKRRNKLGQEGQTFV